MSEAVTSSETPGAAGLVQLGLAPTVLVSKRESDGSRQAKLTRLMLTFSNAFFSSSNYKNLSMDNA